MSYQVRELIINNFRFSIVNEKGFVFRISKINPDMLKSLSKVQLKFIPTIKTSFSEHQAHHLKFIEEFNLIDDLEHSN